MRQQTFTLYYFSIGILFIILEQLHTFFPALIVKSLITFLLMVYYHFRAGRSYGLMHRFIMAGLLFSWMGDILLQFSRAEVQFLLDSDTWFLLGMGAYLLTQIFYTSAFLLPSGRNLILGRRVYQLILVALYGFLLLWLIYHHLGYFRVPVIIYSVALLTMLVSALNRYGKVNGVSYMLVAIGALLFVFSDSMIAINRFYEKVDFARIFIGVTYVTAQYFIAVGCLRQDFPADND